ncbi:FlgD immunoglobulin-like domain containing protein [Verrucomicrobiaceae bacterium 227]
MIHRTIIFAAGALALALPLHATQTDNKGIHAVPLPGKVTIDGSLDDWDLSGKILACYDLENLLEVYSAEVATMYDTNHFYVALHFKDQTPLGNSHDPLYQSSKAWAGDAAQLRFKTDIISHVTAWYYGPKKEPGMLLDYGKSLTEPFGGEKKNLARTEGWKMTGGVEMAFREDADGKGYIQEIKLPWDLITKDQNYAAGKQFSMGVEVFWGEADWPVHRYADNMAEGTSSREFFFTAINSWGPVILEPKGKLDLPGLPYEIAFQNAQQGEILEGPVEITYDLPKDARVTVAIDDRDGNRVRNLVPSLPRKAGRNTEKWDGLNDEGEAVSPGDYAFKLLYHDGIQAKYVMSFANPGNPTWDTADGKGAFYADHSAPHAAAAAGQFVALGCPMGEAGKHLIGLDANGQRLWGLSNRNTFDGGHLSLATDGKTLWVGDEGKSSNIYRVDLSTGRYAPWNALTKDASGNETPMLDLRTTSHPTGRSKEQPGYNQWALALKPGELAASFTNENLVRIFNSETSTTISELPVEAPTALTAMSEGWLVLSKGQLLRLAADGKTTPFTSEKFPEGYGLAADAAGQVYLSVRGSDQNVKVFSPEGKLVREIGIKGGRPLIGRYLPGGMLNPGQIAVDEENRLWVPEEGVSPKRTSLWDTESGKLIREFVGSTSYCGAGAIDPYDPTIAYSNNTIYRIDLDKGTSEPLYSLAKRPVPEDIFPPTVESVSRVVKHGEDTLIYNSGRTGQIRVVVGRDGQWQSAAALGMVRTGKDEEFGVDFEAWPYAGHAGECFAWADQNGDGLVQDSEMTFGSPQVDGKQVRLTAGYWGTYPDPEGTVPFEMPGANVILKFPIKDCTACGAPIYAVGDPEIVRLKSDVKGRNGNALMGGSKGNVYLNQSPLTAIAKDGRIAGTYPSRHVSVHGSHTAMAAKPGYLIGPSSFLGTADFGGEVGEVFYLNGNLGENFLFTHDALWIQSLFKDTRGAFEVPSQAIQGMPMNGITAGSESFGGNFIRTSTGRVYLTLGATDAKVIELTGFDSIRRLNGTLTYTKEQYVAAAQLAQTKAAEASEAKVYTATRLTSPITVDGRMEEWSELLDEQAQLLEIAESAQRRYARVQARYDDDHLYLAWRVSAPRDHLKNEGQDYRLLFKSGDAVDLMIGPDPQKEKGKGNLRLILTQMGEAPTVVLNQKYAPDADKSEAFGFASPWRTIPFDRVAQVKDVTFKTSPAPGGYFVEAALPWKVLGIEAKTGLSLKMDVGVLFGNPSGTTTISRQYWSNKATGLVSDIPGEADLTPELWGTLILK